MKLNGALHLIPVSLGESPLSVWQPQRVRELVNGLTVYIAENAKTARAFLKQVGTSTPLQEITIHTLSTKTPDSELKEWLAPALKGGHIGLLSEAGCPAVADPGAKVVALAHEHGLRVAPWVGPSSILLALMASGLDGQRFTFHGYAPIDAAERVRCLKQWEADSRRLRQTQLFIETPYRNQAMFGALLETLKSDTKLCIATELTTSSEWIRTDTIGRWKQTAQPVLHKKPSIFLFLSRA